MHPFWLRQKWVVLPALQRVYLQKYRSSASDPIERLHASVRQQETAGTGSSPIINSPGQPLP